MPLEILDPSAIPGNAVAVFYQNPEAEIIAALDKYPFRRVQLYAGDVSPEFVRKIKRKVVLDCRIQSPADIERALQYAADVDFFILDGPAPGSGTPVDTAVIPAGFPYPFLLAGGIRTDNIHLIRPFDHCIGVDVASGIETDGAVDIAKIRAMPAAFQY